MVEIYLVFKYIVGLDVFLINILVFGVMFVCVSVVNWLLLVRLLFVFKFLVVLLFNKLIRYVWLLLVGGV